MTNPTFQELLTSQEARSRANKFTPIEGKGTHWLSLHGVLTPTGKDPTHSMAIWQGWLTDCAPPPEPRVFKEVRYVNIYKVEDVGNLLFATKDEAELCGRMNGGCIARVRVEITATEGQFDD